MKSFLFLLIFCFFSSPFSPPTHTWVAIGDSITYLNDHQNETGNRVTKGYLTRVTEELPDLKYINQGHNGWTAVKMAQEIEKIGLVKASVYSVFLGTNDWWQGQPLGTLADYQNNTGPATFYGAYRVILNKIRSLHNKAPILLITPMPRVDFVYINNPKNNAYGSYKEKNGQQLAAFAEAIKAIGKYHKLPVVDLYNKSGITLENLVQFKRLKDPATGSYKNYPYPGFIDIPFNPETDEYPYPPAASNMTYDGLHPSDKGYAVISGLVAGALKKELKFKKAKAR